MFNFNLENFRLEAEIPKIGLPILGSQIVMYGNNNQLYYGWLI